MFMGQCGKNFGMLTMNGFDKIKKMIHELENIIAEIKSELDILSKDKETKPKKIRKNESLLPSNEELQQEYERLYQEFRNKNIGGINEFIKGRNKNYLKAFCNVNKLPIDVNKLSKEDIAREIMRWFAQRMAITQEAK